MIDTALKVSRSLYFFTTFICHGFEKYFPRLWGMGISDAILQALPFRYVTKILYYESDTSVINGLYIPSTCYKSITMFVEFTVLYVSVHGSICAHLQACLLPL